MVYSGLRVAKDPPVLRAGATRLGADLLPAPVDADLLHVQEAGAGLLGALAVAVLVADEEDAVRFDAVPAREYQPPRGIRLHAPDVVASDDVRDTLVEAVRRQRPLDRRVA